jgi:hypothetical protein
MYDEYSRELVDEFKLPNMRLRVYYDSDAESPLTAFDPPFDLVSWSRNIQGTERTPSIDPDDWAQDWREANPNGQLWPVWIYDHGDIALRIAPTPEATGFPDVRWDVGFLGFCVMTESTIQSEWDGDVTKARQYADGALEEFTAWLNGWTWLYEITQLDEVSQDWVMTESCSGFYGVDWRTSGMVGELPPEFQALVSSPTKQHSPSVTP